MRLGRWWLWDSLVLKVPVVQVSDTNVEVSGKGQPSEVWYHAQSSNSIDLGPDVGQVCDSSTESDDVDGSLLWTLEAKKEWHPKVVEAELDGVEGSSVLSSLNLEWRGKW